MQFHDGESNEHIGGWWIDGQGRNAFGWHKAGRPRPAGWYACRIDAPIAGDSVPDAVVYMRFAFARRKSVCSRYTGVGSSTACPRGSDQHPRLPL